MESYRCNGLDGNRSWREVLASSQDYFRERFGRVRVEQSQHCRQDFEPVRTIGTGGFSRVMLVRERNAGGVFALKMVEKEEAVKSNRVRYLKNEKQLLEAIRFPFIVTLLASFQDKVYLYFLMPFLQGGEMYNLLRRLTRLGEGQAKFYTAQILLALEFLHSLGIVYRDLKLENLLLDSRGYLRLVDFGFAKMIGGPRARTFTICGTPQCLAPEVIATTGYGLSADLWSVGVFLWEVLAGYPPFYELSREQLFAAIRAGRTGPYPKEFSTSLRILLQGLLHLDPDLRLDTRATRDHIWFSGLRWLGILNQTERSPYRPELSAGPEDTSQFDTYSEQSDDRPPPTIHNLEEYFKDF